MDALISMSGYVGTEVDFHAGDGWAVARFRLACTPRWERNGEWTDRETTWLSIKASRRLAENVYRSIRKGDPVVVTGKLRSQSWTDSTGNRQDRIVVEATAIGHDLTRGTTAFAKNPPLRVAEPNTRRDESGQIRTAVATRPEQEVTSPSYPVSPSVSGTTGPDGTFQVDPFDDEDDELPEDLGEDAPALAQMG